MDAELSLCVDGERQHLVVDTRVTLLDLRRERLGNMSPKKGCNHGQCGACTVLIDGRRALACLALAVAHDGSEVVTADGLAHDGALHPVAQAFLNHDAFQCGYCTPGQICSAVGMLAEFARGWPSAATIYQATEPKLDHDEVAERMSGTLCGCGAYANIVPAVRSVAADPAAVFLGGGTNLVDHLKLGVPHRTSSSTSPRPPPTRSPTTAQAACASARRFPTATWPPTAASEIAIRSWRRRCSPEPRGSYATWPRQAATRCNAPAAPTSRTSRRRVTNANPGPGARRSVTTRGTTRSSERPSSASPPTHRIWRSRWPPWTPKSGCSEPLGNAGSRSWTCTGYRGSTPNSTRSSSTASSSCRSTCHRCRWRPARPTARSATARPMRSRWCRSPPRSTSQTGSCATPASRSAEWRTSRGGRPRPRSHCAGHRLAMRDYRAAAQTELAGAQAQDGIDGGNAFKIPLLTRTLVATLRGLAREET